MLSLLTAQRWVKVNHIYFPLLCALISFSVLEHSAATLAAANVFDICLNSFNLWLLKQHEEYSHKSNGK